MGERRGVALAGLFAALSLAAACARGGSSEGSAADRTRTLRVGTSFDYAPFSLRGADGAAGFDIEVARAFAASSPGRELELVPFRWSELVPDLEAGRFDVAMGGITVRPERSIAGRFSVPVARTGAVAIARDGAFRDVDDVAARAQRIAVNAGGHLERATRARFARAEVVAVPDNARVLDALLEARVDAVVSDTLEAPHWLARAPGLVLHGPFTDDRKAYLVRAELGELARELDRFLLERERDGTLDRLRRRCFGTSKVGGGADWPRTASVDEALRAAIEERLSLMPLVAAAKWHSGIALEDRAQEQRVLDAAVRAVATAARERGGPAPAEAATRAFFREQIERAKEVQELELARLRDRAAGAPTRDEPAPPDLDRALRPALARIGEKLAFLWAARDAPAD